MGQASQRVEAEELQLFEGLVELYAPYVLVRCAAWTNSRRQAQQMGTYVLICGCLLVSRLRRPPRFGALLEVAAGVAGPDVVQRGEGRDWWGQCTEPLIVETRMRRVAQALNDLPRPAREVVVLHHLAGAEVPALAILLERPVDRVAAQLARAERRLTQSLRGQVSGKPNVGALLAEFRTALDADWLAAVVYYTMDYLVGCAA